VLVIPARTPRHVFVEAEQLMTRYSKQGLWGFFLVCAFPLHAWTIILAFRDFSWVTERTNSWDAVGVVSYGLIFAFIESLLVFLVALLLGFLISKKWTEDRRMALMGLLVFVTSLWAIISYLYFMLPISPGTNTLNFFANLAHPLRVLYAIGLMLAGITVAVPTYFVLQSEKFLQGVRGFFERIGTLSLFYLFFDLIGLVIVILRNV
jgi:hypothetical protein